LLLHCLLVLLLGVLEVGREIYQETVGYQVIDLAFNEDSASQPARASADLHALEQSVNQEVPRQITEAPNIPESTAPMRPTTLPVVRVPAPPDRVVLDTPAPARTEQPDSVPRRLRMQTPVLPTTDTAMKLDPVKPVVEKPTTEPIANPTRQTTTAPAPAEPTSPTRPDVPVKTAVAKIEPTTPAVVPTAKPDQPVFQRQPRAVQVARASSDRVPDVQVAPAPTGEANTPPSATQVDVARTSTTVTATDATRPNSKPSTSPAPTRRTDNLQRVAAATGEAPQEPDQDRPFGRRTLRGDPARAAAVENGPSPMPVVVAKLPGVTPLPGLDTKAPGRSSTAPTLPVETSGDVAGPSRPDDRQLRVGSLGRVASNAPPSVGRADSPYSRRGPRSQTLASMPAFFSPRADRTALVEKRGGTKESEAAVERGLDWLALHQNEDGSWSLEDFNKNCKHAKCSGAGKVHADAGATGLALLPFLAAGYTHQQGKHSRTVQRGLDWLIAQQDKNGLLERGNYRPFYGHGIATLAVCEAFAMTRDERLRGPAQKGLDFIASNQHSSGGWRYTPGQSSDTSVTGWQVMALRSGQIAGLNVPNKTLANVHKWLKSVEGNKPTGGRFGYQGPDVNPAMTAQGLLCLQMLGGTPKTDTRMIAGADYLLENLPQAGKDTSYYWYHATQVMFHMQGKHWEAWNNRFRDMLVNDQIKQGPLAGSWTPRDAREQTGGRLYSTALRLLMLEVYYSHLPIYQQLEGATSKK
ncbi:MAG: prenyltransferase/squalene oxidase repeat-containing protein, partial [Gemmataceae bacterium]